LILLYKLFLFFMIPTVVFHGIFVATLSSTFHFHGSRA